MGWYEHLCYCFCTVYQSDVSADWGLGGRIKPVLHRAWWIAGFTYDFENLGTGVASEYCCISKDVVSRQSDRKGSDLDTPWQLNTQNIDKLWKFRCILPVSKHWTLVAESVLKEFDMIIFLLFRNVEDRMQKAVISDSVILGC